MANLRILYYLILTISFMQFTKPTLDWFKAARLFTNKGNEILKSKNDIHCPNIKGLSKYQRKLCKKYTDLMPYVGGAVTDSLSECQRQFQESLWNCSIFETNKKSGKKSKNYIEIVREPTREKAFVQALLSAAVAHALTTACSRGMLGKRCNCIEGTNRAGKIDVEERFKYGGCSDNTRYGIMMSNRFVGLKYRRPRPGKKWKLTLNDYQERRAMAHHNNDVGRQIVHTTATTICKCHGLSGSCQAETCWRKMIPFRNISTEIRNRFESAVQFRLLGAKKQTIGLSEREPSRHNLIYLQPTPDVCSSRTEDLSVRGRPCNLNTCPTLCCGRGYKKETQLVFERCNCKFQWCCDVVCDTCTKEAVVFRCK